MCISKYKYISIVYFRVSRKWQMGICIRLIQNFIKFGWSTIYHVINFITFLDITISQPNRKVLTNKLLNLFRPRLRAQFKKKGLYYRLRTVEKTDIWFCICYVTSTSQKLTRQSKYHKYNIFFSKYFINLYSIKIYYLVFENSKIHISLQLFTFLRF